MTPFSQAAEAHLSLGSDWPFAALIEAHVQNRGCCIMTPDIFLMARPVHHRWPANRISDPRECCFGPDCWHVWLLAGDFMQAIRFMPYPLPFVSFHRRGRLRVLTLKRVKRMLRAQ